jgi:hypothetical protein
MHTLAQLREGRLAGAIRLDLSCGLTAFPREIFDLADSLEVLNLSGNALDALPHDLHRLHKLRVLFCSDNRFTNVPESIGQCRALDMVAFKANRIAAVPGAALSPWLRWLILTDNAIDHLPDSLGDCTRMQKLMLAGNRLQTLPESMAACEQLELLRLSANRFDTLPDWLTKLPRLAWLAIAGNPFCHALEAAAGAVHRVPSIDWAELTLGVLLGEGASGVIYRAALAGSAEPVAVKLFKGAITSDGWPQSEMAACMAFGAHPDLVAVRGRVVGHPQGIDGLVMTLIDAAFRNLAGPPSLASCTRDVYAADARWPEATALRIAHGIASAVQHLHAQGLVHGDLYAHNILWRPPGEALLGDFGAAALVGDLDPATVQSLQRIEVRAFGCLLEELLARCDPPASHDAATALVERCLQAEVGARPDFDAIVTTLAPMQVPR